MAGECVTPPDPPAVLDVKARARQMNLLLKDQGHSDVGHATCLHELSLQAGYENWQTYGAALRKAAGLPPKRHLTRAAQQRRQERA
ncbi:hypothetical protein GCM10017784_40880 [Deinococcus indicus]|nr:hypothetical protein GCM10017784_40880 [Deinococcus indicus]